MEFNDSVDKLNKNIEALSENIEKLKLGDYIETLNKPMRIAYSNFMWGLWRGLGMAVGFSLLGAVILYFLKYLLALNIPLLGGFIAEIVRDVQSKL